MSSKDDEKYKWKVGDLCTATYDGHGHGLIYRVIKVQPDRRYEPVLTVEPVHGVVAKIEGRKKRELSAGWCKPLSLVDLATMYLEFGQFIESEAKKRGAEPSTTTTKVPAGNADDVRVGTNHDDDSGLCADISAREPI